MHESRGVGGLPHVRLVDDASTPAALRVVRSLVVGLVVAALGATAHRDAGGAVPAAATLAVVGLVAVAGSLAQRLLRTLPGLVLVTVAAQPILHVVFDRIGGTGHSADAMASAPGSVVCWRWRGRSCVLERATIGRRGRRRCIRSPASHSGASRSYWCPGPSSPSAGWTPRANC